MGASVPGENKGVQNVGSGIRGPGSVSRLCHPQSVWLAASPSDPVPWFSHLQNGTALVPSSKADDKVDQRRARYITSVLPPPPPVITFVVITLGSQHSVKHVG